MKNAASQRTFFATRPLAVEIARIFRPGAATALLAAPLAFAAPQGGTVAAGQADIRQSGVLTTVTQGSQRAVIDWRSFNVGLGETVNFVQPGASAAVLNRVVGNDASAIFGRITANGQVYLINPNGILFGSTSQVDVGALTASTANIGNADFMASRLSFNQPGRPGARVENQGSITVAEGGFAALVGRNAVNSGVINARLGKVALAGGDAFVLDLYGDKLVNLIVDPAALAALTDANGDALASSVSHSGEILAEGGQVQLSVATVKHLVDNLINVSGVIRATSFASLPGKISLIGDAGTQVAVSGTLDTSGETGGGIEVTGRDVVLQGGALLAARGGAGGIAVGGDWQGQGALAHAQTVSVAEGALIDASASARGQGGTVALWSDGSTQFAGRIEARGGSAGGDAGQVEVSSKGRLGFQGEVNVFAANGRQGSLLLDPANLRIGSVSSGDSEISADQLRYFLVRGGNVSLSADQNMVVDAEVSGLVTGAGIQGGALTLTAGNNLTINRSIVLNNGPLELTATDGTLGSADGVLLYTGSGSASLRGGAGVDVGQVLSGGAVDIRSGAGTVNVRNSIVAATADGSVAPAASLNVDAAGAVSLNGALVQGNVALRSRNAGVSLATAVIQSNAGDVQVDAGTTLTSNASNVGLVAGGNVSAVASQSIDLGAVISPGVVSLTSTAGGVTVRQAVAGGFTASVRELVVDAAGPVALAGVRAGSDGIVISARSGDVTSQGALLSAGDVTIHADGGLAGTTAAPLTMQAAGSVFVNGNSGVNVDTVLGTGVIALAAAAGSVTVQQAIAAVPGAADASTTQRPVSIGITARDGIDVAGGVAGANGIGLESASGGITFRNGSLFSQGAVNMVADGPISLLDGAGIATTADSGAVAISSQHGTVTVGNAGIRVAGEGASVSLIGQGDVCVNGDIQTRSGGIALTSGQGAVRVLASSTGNDAASNATLDAGGDATRSVISVSAAGDVELGEMLAYNRVQVGSSGGNVVFKRGLGGNAGGSFGGSTVVLNTGYVDYARGYLPQYRPNVGRLVVSAPQGSVELNGVNIDGNANPSDTSPGLQVTAGHRIVSNNQIAVNKGDIELTGGNTLATDGVYLGSSVYSRGHDSVGADGVRGGSDDQKTGYGIRINGRTLGLFDNTVEMAQLPVNVYLYTNGALGTVHTDIESFLVDAAGLRLVNGDGSYQMAGVLRSVGYPFPYADARIYNVVYKSFYNSAGDLLYRDRVVASGNPSAGEAVVGAVVGAQGTLVASMQEIAKIEVANNVANYQDAANAATLIPATVGTADSRTVQIGTSVVAGIANHGAQTPMHLSDPLPTFTALSRTPIVSAPATPGMTAAEQGIGLKILGFREAGDTSTLVWSSSISMTTPDGEPFIRSYVSPNPDYQIGALVASVPLDGMFTVSVPALAKRTYIDTSGQPAMEVIKVPVQAGQAKLTFEFDPGTPNRVLLRAVDLTQVSSAGLPAFNPAMGSHPSTWLLSGWQPPGTAGTLRLQAPTINMKGSAFGVNLGETFLYQTRGEPLPVQNGAQVAPDFSLQSPDLYLVGGSTTPRTYRVNQVVVDSKSTGDYLTKPGTRVFVYDGIISAAVGRYVADSSSGIAIPGLSGISGFNNSTIGFASVGAGFGTQVAGNAAVAGAGSGSGQGVLGVAIPSGSGVMPLIDDRSAQDTAGTVVVRVKGNEPVTDGMVFGARAAAQADFGRGGAVPGSSVNVFKRNYRVATSSSNSVCSPDVVQTQPADGVAARECPAGR